MNASFTPGPVPDEDACVAVEEEEEVRPEMTRMKEDMTARLSLFLPNSKLYIVNLITAIGQDIFTYAHD